MRVTNGAGSAGRKSLPWRAMIRSRISDGGAPKEMTRNSGLEMDGGGATPLVDFKKHLRIKNRHCSK
jgi:hypothetical protein